MWEEFLYEKLGKLFIKGLAVLLSFFESIEFNTPEIYLELCPIKELSIDYFI